VEAAIEFILMTVSRWRSEHDKDPVATIAIVAPNKHLCAALKEALARANIPASLIDGQHLDNDDPKKISIATMHRAKGLEFDQVIVLAEALAPMDGNWIAQTQRRLLYVAVTRAKRRTSILWLP
jgi:superfamily I DNA/RNA helicase